MKTIRVRIKLTGKPILVTENKDRKTYTSVSSKVEYKGSEITIL